MLSFSIFFGCVLVGELIFLIVLVYDHDGVQYGGVEVSRAMGHRLGGIVCGFRLCNGLRLEVRGGVGRELRELRLLAYRGCTVDGSKS